MCKSKLMKIAYCVVSLLVVVVMIINMTARPVYAAEVESLPVYDLGIKSWYDSTNVYVEHADGSVVSALHGNEDGLPLVIWYSPEKKIFYYFIQSNDNSHLKSYDGEKFYFDPDFNSIKTVVTVEYFNTVTDSYYSAKTWTVKGTTSSTWFIESIVDENGEVDELSDLLCVYSTYEIKGFFEFSADSDIYTPDYYFDYQYLFYTEGIGYVFVDSSEPLLSVSNPSSSTSALLTFNGVCNKHVYTSELGTAWSVDNSVSTMYGDSYTMDYSYFYDSPGGSSCYTLVYSNDGNYVEEPLLTPEYGNINDVVSDLLDIEWVGGSFVGTGSYQNGSTAGSGATWSEWILLNLLSSDELNIDGFLGPNDEYYNFNGQTIFSLIQQIFYEEINIKTVLNDEIDELTLTLHNNLKSVFDNITNTNTYLYDIKGIMQDLPDYSKQLAKLTSIGSAGNDLTNTSNAILDEINNNILALNTGSGSSSSSTTDITQDFLVTLDDDILSMLEKVDNSIDELSVGLVVDEFGELADEVVDDDIFSDFLDDVLDEDNADKFFVDGGSFIANAISSIGTGGLLLSSFELTNEVTDGVNFVNAGVVGLYDASGAMQKIILLGASLSVAGVVVRRGGLG